MRASSLLAAAAIACCAKFSLAASGANEPIDPNELGLTATDCAEQYCTSKDGMMLWFSLENTCMKKAQPFVSFAAVEVASDTSAIWSPTTVGLASALMGVVGLVVGHSAGGRFTSPRAGGVYYPVA